MGDGEFTGVEYLSCEVYFEGMSGAVEGIPHDGIAHVGTVDSDLVGAPRFQLVVHQGIITEAFPEFPVGNGRSSGVADGHFFAIALVAIHGGINRAMGLLRTTIDNT